MSTTKERRKAMERLDKARATCERAFFARMDEAKQRAAHDVSGQLLADVTDRFPAIRGH